MRVPYRRMMEALRFLLLFVTCTLLSYGIITLITAKLLPDNPYGEPHGNAVKVVKLVNSPETQDLDGYLSRLQLFYVTGE
ncbi:YqzK family protein [Brevibacillus choshinensis]|uniref:YqzK family protein n=1 Tax=Brevibacillus choshinensis TaxID=54911 RepID=A0ABX7FWJ2_BRECH|nr:YqzK family protein [Brevibacillus choshinensis]QRG69832.1 YqzK family protein [Brevibacillus choshinensis]